MVVTGFGAGDSPDYPNEIYVPGNGEYISSTNNDDRTNRDTFRNKRAQYGFIWQIDFIKPGAQLKRENISIRMS